MKNGFTVIEIMIVVLIIGILVAAAVPNFLRARETSQTRLCVTSLRTIAGAKDLWAMENRKNAPDIPTQADLLPYLKAWPKCPAGGAYSINSVGTPPECSLGGDHSL